MAQRKETQSMPDSGNNSLFGLVFSWVPLTIIINTVRTTSHNFENAKNANRQRGNYSLTTDFTAEKIRLKSVLSDTLLHTGGTVFPLTSTKAEERRAYWH